MHCIVAKLSRISEDDRIEQNLEKKLRDVQKGRRGTIFDNLVTSDKNL